MNLEERVTALEQRLDQEAGLRASVDRDLGSLGQTVRAQHHLIQALAITQGQHTDTLDRHTQSLDAAHEKLDRIIALLTRLTAEPPDDPGGGNPR